MLAMEEVLSELNGEELNEQGLPPGFRFHPTDEELITFYLASKVFKGSFCGVEIAEVDLNRCEPWELPDVAKMGEREWYFYSLRDRKYPTGLRTNRATGAGYWKATGKDREVYSASSGALLGMKKTLVFYRGRAPRGEKTKWVMHEYRLDGDFSYRHACKEEWVICRIFHKNGEKKNPIFPCQSYLLESALSSSTTSSNKSLPPTAALIDCQNSQAAMRAFQNPLQIHHPSENDLKSLVMSSQSQVVQPSFEHNKPTPITTNLNNPIPHSHNMYIPSPSTALLPPSLLFKSLLSNQDSTVLVKQQHSSDIFQQTNNKLLTHFEIPCTEINSSTSNSFMDSGKILRNAPYHQHQHQQHDEHQNALFFETESGAGAEVSVHDISTSVAFNRPGFQTMVEPHNIRSVHGESWPLDA